MNGQAGSNQAARSLLRSPIRSLSVASECSSSRADSPLADIIEQEAASLIDEQLQEAKSIASSKPVQLSGCIMADETRNLYSAIESQHQPASALVAAEGQTTKGVVYTPNLRKGAPQTHHERACLDEKVKQVELFGVRIVALTINDKERLCLAQISNTLLKEFSYNEIHNRRVALGITCVQCTPIQLEMLRRAGAMPSSSRRCGMITMREAERLCRSFLVEEQPPELPENFYFTVAHKINYGCKGRFIPARYISSRAKCIECFFCGEFYSPNKFIFHSHRHSHATDCNPPDSPNINSWRKHIDLDAGQEQSLKIKYAWEDVKSLFNGGTRRRAPPICAPAHATVKTISVQAGGGAGQSNQPVGQFVEEKVVESEQHIDVEGDIDCKQAWNQSATFLSQSLAIDRPTKGTGAGCNAKRALPGLNAMSNIQTPPHKRFSAESLIQTGTTSIQQQQQHPQTHSLQTSTHQRANLSTGLSRTPIGQSSFPPPLVTAPVTTSPNEAARNGSQRAAPLTSLYGQRPSITGSTETYSPATNHQNGDLLAKSTPALSAFQLAQSGFSYGRLYSQLAQQPDSPLLHPQQQQQQTAQSSLTSLGSIYALSASPNTSINNMNAQLAIRQNLWSILLAGLQGNAGSSAS